MRLIDADRITMEYCIATGCTKGHVSECKKRCKNGQQICRKMELIFSAETVEVAPAVHGKWSYDEAAGGYLCSLCNGYTYEIFDDVIETDKGVKCVETLSNYCPHCGARMDGEAE